MSSNLNSIFYKELSSEVEELSNLIVSINSSSDLTDILEDMYIIVHTIKGNTSAYKNTAKPKDLVFVNNIDLLITFTHKTEDFFEKLKDNPVINKDYETLFLDIDSVFTDFINIFKDNTYQPNTEWINSVIDRLISIPLNSNQKDKSQNLTNKYKIDLKLSCIEELKHPILAIVYRELKTHFIIEDCNPTDEELLKGNDFDAITATLVSDLTIEEIKKIIDTISEIESAELTKLNNDTGQNEKHFEKPVEKHINTLLKIETSRIDNVLKHTSQLVILRNKLNEFLLENNFLAGTAKGDELASIFEDLTSHVEYLQESVLDIRMTPFEHLFNRFPKDVKAIGLEFGKEINFSHSGQRTEIDKNILDELYEPIIHIIRNSIIHGIEDPETRLSKNKDAIGSIYIEAKHKKNKVQIIIGDDGKGIDLEEVKKKALELNLYTKEQLTNMSKTELVNLIFSQGLSTSNNVNKYSGRGVGMSAFRKKIEELQGYYDIETEKDKGTKFIIYLPLTTTIIEAIVTKINNTLFSIPLTQIKEITKVSSSNILMNNQKPYFFWRDIEIPLIYGNELFKDNSPLHKKNNYIQSDNNTKDFKVVIVHSHNQLVGLTFDEFINQQSIVVKQLHSFLSTSQHIDSYHIVSDGSISLIIDTNGLTKI